VSGVTSEEAETWTVSVHARSATADPDKLAHLMRQEVTDQTLRMRIAERTDPIRNLIFAVAFSRTDLQSADAAAVARPEQP
jgi:His-Xaa-Ser system protein HxsD